MFLPTGRYNHGDKEGNRWDASVWKKQNEDRSNLYLWEGVWEVLYRHAKWKICSAACAHAGVNINDILHQPPVSYPLISQFCSWARYPVFDRELNTKQNIRIWMLKNHLLFQVAECKFQPVSAVRAHPFRARPCSSWHWCVCISLYLVAFLSYFWRLSVCPPLQDLSSPGTFGLIL